MPTPEGEDTLAALVSVWIDAYDRRAPFERALAALGHRFAGYLVVESVYDDYGTTRVVGPARLARRRTLARRAHGRADPPSGRGSATRSGSSAWHGTQSPLSAELQPRTRYVRNEVVRAVTADAPEVHGIVEEAWASRRGRRRPDAVLQLGWRPGR